MNVAGWQVSRFYFLGTFSNFIFQFEYLLAKIYSHFPTIPTKPYFLTYTRFIRLYYPPGSCGHLSLLLLGTIQFFCGLKTLVTSYDNKQDFFNVLQPGHDNVDQITSLTDIHWGLKITLRSAILPGPS